MKAELIRLVTVIWAHLLCSLYCMFFLKSKLTYENKKEGEWFYKTTLIAAVGTSTVFKIFYMIPPGETMLEVSRYRRK